MKKFNLRNILFVGVLVLVVVVARTYNSYRKALNSSNNDIDMFNRGQQTQSTVREVYNQGNSFLNNQIEQEAYDKNYIYFKGMEKVYSILKYSEVEDMKVKLTFYIKNKVSAKANECVVTVLDNNETTLKLGLKIDDRNLRAIILKANPAEFTIVE